MNIGERITYFRNSRGLTTNRLANLTGISQSFLRDVELSNKGITVDNLSLVCNALDITLQDFFAEPHSDISDLDILQYINGLTQEQKVRLFEFLKTIKHDY